MSHPGYGAPQPGYGAPPGGAPGQYGAPPPGQSGYGAPPGGAPGYGAPPQQGYGAPPQQGYGAPPGAAPGYGAPPSTTAHGHGSPPGAPPSTTGFGQPQVDPQIAGWFSAVDGDRSGQIDEHELSRALGMGGQQFSVECSKLMIKMFDKDHSGKIGLQEFQQLHNYIMQMQAGFRHVDRDGSGHLSAQEVNQALSTSGYNLSPQSFDGLMKKFDRSKSGGLRLDGYVELCCFLGTARNVFSAYDTQRTGQVTFGFDQFIYAVNLLHS